MSDSNDPPRTHPDTSRPQHRRFPEVNIQTLRWVGIVVVHRGICSCEGGAQRPPGEATKLNLGLHVYGSPEPLGRLTASRLYPYNGCSITQRRILVMPHVPTSQTLVLTTRTPGVHFTALAVGWLSRLRKLKCLPKPRPMRPSARRLHVSISPLAVTYLSSECSLASLECSWAGD